MDETTHGFSRKVIDRALTIDFQEFYPNEYDKYFIGKIEPAAFTYSKKTHITEEKDLLVVDKHEDGKSKTVSFLADINKIMKNTPFELAYRALNEILLSVNCAQPADEKALHAVWDDFLMQKVLPRIEGDNQKLKIIVNENDVFLKSLKTKMSDEKFKESLKKVIPESEYGKDTILHYLYVYLMTDVFTDIWEGELRPHLLSSIDINIGCRSKKKLEWMMRRLQTNHFTDFWV